MARSSLLALTASMAFFSQSWAWALFSISSRSSRFSSAMAMATAFLESISCWFMSTIIWLSIFSGFSALDMRSFMFDEITVLSLSKIPMSYSLLPAANFESTG